jgi:hypothetical protein
VVWRGLKPCQLSDFVVRGFKSALDFVKGLKQSYSDFYCMNSVYVIPIVYKHLVLVTCVQLLTPQFYTVIGL